MILMFLFCSIAVRKGLPKSHKTLVSSVKKAWHDTISSLIAAERECFPPRSLARQTTVSTLPYAGPFYLNLLPWIQESLLGFAGKAKGVRDIYASGFDSSVVSGALVSAAPSAGAAADSPAGSASEEVQRV